MEWTRLISRDAYFWEDRFFTVSTSSPRQVSFLKTGGTVVVDKEVGVVGGSEDGEGS